MSEKNLEEIFKKAADISKNAPTNLQEIAFNRALDALLNIGDVKKDRAETKDGKTELKKSKHQIPKTTANSNKVDFLIKNIDRTKHQEIFDAPNVLTSSLYLLELVKNDYQIDGLGPTDIARILTDKFRLRTTRQAVTQALDSAGNKVDRVSVRGSHPYYRIMHKGEEYLNKKEFEADAEINNESNKKISPKTTSTLKNTNSKSRIKSGNKKKLGSKKIMTDLITEGFFDNPKKIKDIQEYIDHKLGYSFDVTSLSPNLTRLLREGKLDRDKTNDGQYEYSRK